MAFDQRRRFRGDQTDARPWLLGIATNLLRRHWRAEQRQLKAFARTLELAPVRGDDAIVTDRCEAWDGQTLARALAKLSRDDRDALFSAITAGAHGYIAKDADVAQLVGAIHLVAGGGSAFGGSITEGLAAGVAGLDYSPGEYERRRLDLSERELQVLRLLATPMTAAQIAARLFLSAKTVQNHASAIYQKLGVHSRSEAVVKGMELHLISGGS